MPSCRNLADNGHRWLAKFDSKHFGDVDNVKDHEYNQQHAFQESRLRDDIFRTNLNLQAD